MKYVWKSNILDEIAREGILDTVAREGSGRLSHEDTWEKCTPGGLCNRDRN